MQTYAPEDFTVSTVPLIQLHVLLVHTVTQLVCKVLISAQHVMEDITVMLLYHCNHLVRALLVIIAPWQAPHLCNRLVHLVLFALKELIFLSVVPWVLIPTKMV